MEEGSIRQMVEKGIKEAIRKEEGNREKENKVRNTEARRWEEWERERRRNNIIITGLETERRMERKEIEEWVEKELEVKVKIVRIWTIKGRRSMIGAECANREEKEKVMKGKSKLKGKRIYIDNDRTFKERKVREEIGKIAREMREIGKIVKIGYNKLIINGEEYRWKEEEGKLINRRGEEIREEEENF